ncbi:hypothetical protein AB0I28_04850 [Phytomonospora sp. NPDC050363]|uniref:hypothetical protein n=1 Tax=Phytomonospora sp. NPDC050363 TaxID=3155642 RepID=UPI0033F1C45A
MFPWSSTTALPTTSTRCPGGSEGTIPFGDNAFDVVLNRHESYLASEVGRVLKPGGAFLTQQVADGWSDDLHDVLGLPRPPATGFTRDFAVTQAEAGGLTVVESGEGADLVAYADVAPLVWYVRITAWAVPGLDPAASRPLWREVQRRIESDGPLVLREPRFWLRATV